MVLKILTKNLRNKKTRVYSRIAILEWKNEDRKPDKTWSLLRLEFMPRNGKGRSRITSQYPVPVLKLLYCTCEVRLDWRDEPGPEPVTVLLERHALQHSRPERVEAQKTSYCRWENIVPDP